MGDAGDATAPARFVRQRARRSFGLTLSAASPTGPDFLERVETPSCPPRHSECTPSWTTFRCTGRPMSCSPLSPTSAGSSCSRPNTLHIAAYRTPVGNATLTAVQGRRCILGDGLRWGAVGHPIPAASAAHSQRQFSLDGCTTILKPR